ncbi:MAG: flippase-like domain-containing protein [Saprospiraceae bacterium]|nr:flippase-like domain-containing protein [Saprospiraceae bacterium]
MNNIDLEEPNIEKFNKQEVESVGVLNSISPFRIFLAAIIGLGVVIYMFVQDFNAQEFGKIDFSQHVFFWIGMAFFFMCFRHFCYMVRLRIITDGFFSWKKSFELVMMWEFSSAVTPTSVGGAAVAMFAIAQEKLAAGKTAMIVLYTVIVDTFSFLSALLIFFLIFGPIMIQPQSDTLVHLLTNSEWGIAFVTAYTIMLLYGGAFFYGVIINATKLENLLLWFCKLPFLRRFREKAIKITDDMDLASHELRAQKWPFHLGTYLCTMLAWASRFMVLNCLIIGFVAFSPNPEIQAHYNNFMDGQLNLSAFGEQVFIYARQQAMYVIMAVMPSPGGAGVAEYAFQTFHFDYIPTKATGIAAAGTLMVIMATLWRGFTYYIYLFIGAIVVPNWINKIIKRNRAEAKMKFKNSDNISV